jgi:hypothetical protein
MKPQRGVLQREYAQASRTTTLHVDVARLRYLVPRQEKPDRALRASAPGHQRTSRCAEINGRAFADARRRINGFIAEVYNKDRLHSALGYQSLLEFETALAQNKARQRIMVTALSQKLSVSHSRVQSRALVFFLFSTSIDHRFRW